MTNGDLEEAQVDVILTSPPEDIMRYLVRSQVQMIGMMRRQGKDLTELKEECQSRGKRCPHARADLDDPRTILNNIFTTKFGMVALSLLIAVLTAVITDYVITH